MFRMISLRLKLTLIFLPISLLVVEIGIYQMQTIQHLNNAFIEVADADLKRLDALREIDLVGAELRGQTVEYQQAVTANTATDAKELKAKTASIQTQLKEGVQGYLSIASADISADDLRTIDESAKALIQKSIIIMDTVEYSTSPSTTSTLNAYGSDLVQAQETLDMAISKVMGIEQTSITSRYNDFHQSTAAFTSTTIVLGIVIIVIAIAMGLLIAQWISKSISTLRKGVERLANGDFSKPIAIKSRDELGQLAASYNSMAERLKESYHRLSIEQQRDIAMLQSMGEGLVAINSDEQIVLINPAAITLLGLSNDTSPLNKVFHEAYQLYDKDDKLNQPLPVDQRPFSIAIRTGQPVDGVFSYHREDGNAYLVNVVVAPVRVGEKAAGAIMVLRNVTKEKEIDRMKTEFISLASHQLRTPLSAIKWFTEMLISGDAGKLQSEQLEFISSIDESNERMIALVNGLLNISRIESGRIVVAPKPTDLRELVGGIVTDLKAMTEAKQQTLIISVHQDLPMINVDPQLIGQVYMNLLTNAIKYTPKGGEISVFISKKVDTVISQVTDNGYGIPIGQQNRIFQKFFRAANAAKVETDGTGLGLYLIKAIVESSGGKIWFESEEGKGTTFWFTIPLSGMKQKEGEVTLDVQNKRK